MSTKYKDHLGQEFPSMSAMARHWNIDAKRLGGRLAKNWDIEKALTTPVMLPKRGFVDHLGVRYETLSDMARAWNINFFTLRLRLVEKKWDVEKALTKPVIYCGKKSPEYKTKEQRAESTKKYFESLVCTDHKGVEYPTITAMCEAYGVRLSTFETRKAKGYPLELCLSKKSLVALANARNPHAKKTATDHLGITYPSIKEMCAAWGVAFDVYNSRRTKQGMSLEDALICPRSVCPTFVMSGTKKYFFVNKRKFNSPSEAADFFNLPILPEDFDGMTDEEICGVFAREVKSTAAVAKLAERFQTDPKVRKNIGLLKSWGIDPDTAHSLAKVLKIPRATSGHKLFNLYLMFKKAHICPRIVEPYSTNRWNYGIFSVSECALSPRAFAKVLKERFGC